MGLIKLGGNEPTDGSLPSPPGIFILLCIELLCKSTWRLAQSYDCVSERMFNRRSFTDLFYRTCAKGYAQMSPEAQACLTDSVQAAQGPDGLFYGRAGQEDLYYTFFGLLLATITGAKIQRKKCNEKLRSMDFAALDLVHACAWLRAKRLLRRFVLPRWIRNLTIAAPFDFAELPPSAFPQQDRESPYSQFLLSTLYADFGKTLREPNLAEYRLPSGLYANLKHHSEYGVNATAAALFLISNEKADETADALLSLQESDGTFKAVASAPEGDLLSTATAIFALKRRGRIPKISVKSLLRECFRDNGFFAAAPDDPHGDLEYTVYGLLAMGINKTTEPQS